MKNIIKELWRGNVMPPEDGRQNTPEMQQLLEYISIHNDGLLKTMTDEQKEILKSSTIAGVSTQAFQMSNCSNMHLSSVCKLR